MNIRSTLLGSVLAIAGLAGNASAGATTLTSSLASWQAGVGSAPVTYTATTGLFDPLALTLATTPSIPLADGQTATLSTPAQVTEPQNGFPYLLSDGFSGDLLIPVNATGAQVTSETIKPSSSISAFGFEVVPFSSDLAGPFNLTVTLSTGQTATVSEPGADFNTGSTTPAFFGYYGGPVSSLTITTTDPNGLAFGNFADVPEPATAALLLGGIGLLFGIRRRIT